MKGLEISEILLSKLERTLRLDSEYFLKMHLHNAALLGKQKTTTIAASASVSDGNHFSISEHYVDDGVPYYRGQDVVGQFFVEQSSPNFIERTAYESHLMKRSHLQKGDVLLSIVGSIGEASLVLSEMDATCSCKLAILRPRTIQAAYLASFLRGKYGHSQTQRLTRGAVQMSLLLEDMDQVLVPEFSENFEFWIAHVVNAAFEAIQANAMQISNSEALIFHCFGLENWHAPEPLTYTARLSDAFAGGRLDAEYQQPKYDALFNELSTKFPVRELSSLGKVTKGVTVPYYEDGDIQIIRSGDLGRFDTDSFFLRSNTNESIFLLEKGDVLISSIGFGSIGKVQVFDKEGTFGTVSEVTVIRQKAINSYYLAAFLGSKAGQMQIERHITGATGQLHLYPRDVSRFWIPVLSDEQQAVFEEQAKNARSKKALAGNYLDAAKRAVEIAIERDEPAAMAYLMREGALT